MVKLAGHVPARRTTLNRQIIWARNGHEILSVPIPHRAMSETRQKRGRNTPAVLLSKQDWVDAAAGLKGRAVLVPSCALAALESVHGPHKYLDGIVKVI